jgi:hypothetical protein
MKVLMLGARLAASLTAILGCAPALAQPGDQAGDQRDPYYDQPPPLSQAPISQAPITQAPVSQAPQPQPAQPLGRPTGPPAEGGYQSARGYQPPPAPPAGQPGFQAYQGGQPAAAYAPRVRAYAPDDRDYDMGRAYRVYGLRPDRWSDPYRAASAWRYTGRVGQVWRNPEGQYCIWRQRTWLLPNGRRLYQWVPGCDD